MALYHTIAENLEDISSMMVLQFIISPVPPNQPQILESPVM